MRYKYIISDADDLNKCSVVEGMSLKKIIKTLDPKKTFIVEYGNKKGNFQKKIIRNGKHSDYNSTDSNSIR